MSSLRSWLRWLWNELSWPRRLAIAAFLIIGVIIVATGAVPDFADLQRWSQRTGPWFPICFVLAYIGLTQFPIPRTIFTVSAGLFFGLVTGASLALLATVISAGLSFIAVKLIGRQVVVDWLHRAGYAKRMQSIDDRLRERGAWTVLGLRMVPVVPFSILNYVCALSPIRLVPFLLASAVGSAPGTIVTVALAHSLSQGGDPRALVGSIVTALVGIVILLLEARRSRIRHSNEHST